MLVRGTLILYTKKGEEHEANEKEKSVSVFKIGSCSDEVAVLKNCRK